MEPIDRCAACGYRDDLSPYLKPETSLCRDVYACRWRVVAALTGLNPSAIKELVEAAEEVWNSVPATYEAKHPTVIRHAAALNRIHRAVEEVKRG